MRVVHAGTEELIALGNGLNVVKVMPESAIKFGSYEAAKRALARLEGHDNPRAINPYSQFVAGGVGGIVSQYGSTLLFGDSSLHGIDSLYTH